MLNRLGPDPAAQPQLSEDGSNVATPRHGSQTIEPRRFAASFPSFYAGGLVGNASAMPANGSQLNLPNNNSRDDSTSSNTYSATYSSSLCNLANSSSSATSKGASSERRSQNGHPGWSASEDDLLLRCYRSYYAPRGWPKVAREFFKLSTGPARTVNAVSSRYRKLLEQSASLCNEGTGHQEPLLGLAHRSQSMSTEPLSHSPPTLRPQATAAASPTSATRSSMTSLPSLGTGPRSNANATGSASTASSSTIASPTDGLLLKKLSASAISSVPPASNRRRWPEWTRSEDKLLFQCVQKLGTRWDKVQAAFRGAGGKRGKWTLQTRYEQLCEAAAKEKMAAQRGQGSSAGQADSSTPALAPGDPSLLPRSSAQDSSWTQEEEACLLQVALERPKLRVTEGFEDESKVLHDIFRAVFPNTTKAPESVHAKCCDLLENYDEAVEYEEDADDVREGERGDDHEFVTNEGVSASQQGAPISTEQQMDEQEPSASSQHLESEDQDMAEPQATAIELASRGEPSPRHEHTTSVAPSTSTLQSTPTTTTTAPTGITIKGGFSSLNHPLRFGFDKMLANSRICIFFPDYYEIHPSAIEQVLPGSPEENADFVFSILQDGSLLTLVTPLGTRCRAVFVDAEGKEVGREARVGGKVKVVGIEHRFTTVEAFVVVFFEPL